MQRDGTDTKLKGTILFKQAKELAISILQRFLVKHVTRVHEL